LHTELYSALAAIRACVFVDQRKRLSASAAVAVDRHAFEFQLVGARENFCDHRRHGWSVGFQRDDRIDSSTFYRYLDGSKLLAIAVLGQKILDFGGF
jgi:hypothetical protein